MSDLALVDWEQSPSIRGSLGQAGGRGDNSGSDFDGKNNDGYRFREGR